MRKCGFFIILLKPTLSGIQVAVATKSPVDSSLGSLPENWWEQIIVSPVKCTFWLQRGSELEGVRLFFDPL